MLFLHPDLTTGWVAMLVSVIDLGYSVIMLSKLCVSVRSSEGSGFHFFHMERFLIVKIYYFWKDLALG